MWSSEWPSSRRSTTTSRSGSPRRVVAASTSRAGPAAGRRPGPALGGGVAGHGDQPGAGLALGAGGRREPAGGGVEHLGGQLGRLGSVAGPGQQVAVDALDLVVEDERERLAVAGGGAFEQGALARQLGGHVAAPAGAGGRLDVRRTLGSEGQGGWLSAAEQELHRGRQHDHDEQGGHDNGGPSSHAAGDSTRSGRPCAHGPRSHPWPAGPWPRRGSRGAPRAGPCGRRPRSARPARG